MKINRTIWITACLLAIVVVPTLGQSFDEDRMERDLKIGENVLGTLTTGNTNRGVYFSRKVESNYLPDYGVIFSIPSSTIVLSASSGDVYISTGGESAYVVSGTAEAPEVEKKEQNEKRREEALEAAREQISTFLVDYADLIGQLKPTDRIVVQMRGRNDRIFFYNNQSASKNKGMSAQILKKDITSYKQGKISREEAMGKIEWTNEEDEEVAKDIELFATIFARLYEPDLSSTYYASSRSIGYTSLENFGITFSMKVYSSSSDNGLHTIRTTGESGLSQEERNNKVEAMYPEFEESFKQNLLDYGRTIKSLKPDEMVIFKVELTECKGCNMPEEIEVSVKGKTLKDYDSGSLSRDKALALVTVKKK